LTGNYLESVVLCALIINLDAAFSVLWYLWITHTSLGPNIGRSNHLNSFLRGI